MRSSWVWSLLACVAPVVAGPVGPPGPDGGPPPPPGSDPRSKLCLNQPGDAQWPSDKDWSKFNQTIGGRLVATVPIGSVCHAPNYDADKCSALQSAWSLPQTHFTSTSSVMQSYFANDTCQPFDDVNTPCTLGNYVAYAVNVSNAQDIALAIKFARLFQIRVVVRNTGHDFFGRSTGAGALAIWTQNLKTTAFVDYSDSQYTGKAMKMGAGLLGYEAVEAAHAQGLTVVGGECPTVGIAGGYTLGGGHSALSTAFGLGADQVLEYEVVTADGNVRTANAKQNTDLYWALSGGGGGTYGVVTSMTVRAHADLPIGGGTMTIAAAYTTQDKFEQALAAFHSMLPAMTDAGASVVYVMSSSFLLINPVTAYNSTGDYVKNTVLGPFIAKLAELGVPALKTNFTTLSYRDHFDTYMGPLPYGHVTVESYTFGSRLIPRSTLETNNDNFMAVIKNLTASGVTAAGSAADYRQRYSGIDNSVLPAWRQTTVHLQITVPWDEKASFSSMVAGQQLMTKTLVPQLEAVVPNSGVYLNEGDFQNPNWKKDFFGANYNRLLQIKNKYDPYHVFYGLKSVGSDAWSVDASGRMCST